MSTDIDSILTIFLEDNDLLSDWWNTGYQITIDNTSIVVSTPKDDDLTGTENNDLFFGLWGDDTVLGLSGNDLIFGGNGKDVLEGGEGDDRIFGGRGKDVARYSGKQQDFIFKGSSERFQVVGAEGRDILQNVEFLEFEDGLVPTNQVNFLPAPLFNRVDTIETTITTSGDSADIYFPVASNSKTKVDSLPVALFLQGANVDKSNYSTFASVVASYGFVVVVPNNLRTIDAPPPTPALTGLFPELPQVNEVFDYVRDTEVSPVADIIDPDKLVLLGHSFGGAVGLSAVQGFCPFPFCPFGEFERPDELAGAAFFGTNLKPSDNLGVDEIPILDNTDIPTALILGTNDGRTLPDDTVETYNKIEDPPKALISVEDVNHFGITNDNNPTNPDDTATEVPPILLDSNTQTLSQEVAIDTIATWSSLFLRATVLEDEAAFDFVFGGIGDDLDSNVSVISELPSDSFSLSLGFEDGTIDGLGNQSLSMAMDFI